MQLLNFCTGRPLHLWSEDCALCLAPVEDRLVCRACRAELPSMPPCCHGCALPLPEEGLCGTCQAHPPAFDETCAAFEYRFPVDRLVQRFKYGGDLAIGAWLAQRLAERVGAAPRPDLLVVPPLARGRLAERGFNQALELARPAARRIGVPLAIRGVRRVRETPAQARLTQRERRANLRDAFACELDLTGRHVAIVDDVLTTGATADALAGVLRARGAERVSVWVVARAPDPAGRS